MADEEIILLYIRRALSPTLGKHFLCTAAKHLADHGPMWETSIGVTFRFHHRLVSSDNPVEVLQHAETFFFSNVPLAWYSLRKKESYKFKTGTVIYGYRTKHQSVHPLYATTALTMMRTAPDQCLTMTLASRNGLLYWTLSKLALLPACQRSNDQFSCSHVQILGPV
jgi:hypothetical protein